jgi:hypothetical protein
MPALGINLGGMIWTLKESLHGKQWMRLLCIDYNANKLLLCINQNPDNQREE